MFAWVLMGQSSPFRKLNFLDEVLKDLDILSLNECELLGDLCAGEDVRGIQERP